MKKLLISILLACQLVFAQTEAEEQKQVSLEAAARANVTLENIYDYLEKADAEITPDEHGLIHVQLVFAEVIDRVWMIELCEALEGFDRIRAGIDLKGCVFYVTTQEIDYDPEYCKVIHIVGLDQVESLIVPDDCPQCVLYDCENLKYIQLSKNQIQFLNTFSCCFHLKYIFIPRPRKSSDVTIDFSVPFGCKTQYVWESDAEEYRKTHADFDEPVERLHDPEDCLVRFSKPGVYLNESFDTEIVIPKNQEKNQIATLRFVFMDDRNCVVYEKKFQIKAGKNNYKFKKISVSSFALEPSYMKYGVTPFVPEISFEDGTYLDFYDTYFCIADEDRPR